MCLAPSSDAGEESLILLGDPAYYRRFGFRRDLESGLVLRGPVDRERFLGRELGGRAGRGGSGHAIGGLGRISPPAAHPRGGFPRGSA